MPAGEHAVDELTRSKQSDETASIGCSVGSPGFFGTIQSTKQKSRQPSSSFNNFNEKVKCGGQIKKKLDSYVPSNLALQPRNNSQGSGRVSRGIVP
jgi:hypothetical protein